MSKNTVIRVSESYYKAPPSSRSFLAHVIETEERLFLYDPNTLAIEAQDDFKDLGNTCTTSELSGQPAYIYGSFDGNGVEMKLHLTGKELGRMHRLNLTPKEYFALKKAHGLFFEIHDDFYDESTGEALQPRGF